MFRLIFSDFHLGRGKLNKDGTPNPREDFTHDEDFADLLKYFSEGDYEREEAEIIFNGDTFNLIQTLAERAESKEYITEEEVYYAMEETVEGHRLFFDSISRFFVQRSGRVVFIPGNHDQPILHQPIQELIKKYLDAEVLFVPMFYEFDRIYCEHGHNTELINRYDPFSIWYTINGRKVLKMPWGSHFVVQVVTRFKEELSVIDKIKPFRDFLRWGFYFKPLFTFKVLSYMGWFYIKNRFLNPHKEHRMLFKLDFSAIAEGVRHSRIDNYLNFLAKKGKKTVILGHTHIPMRRVLYGVEYLNTGTWIDMESIDAGSLGRKWEKTFVFIRDKGKREISLKVWRGFQRLKEEWR